MLDKSEACFNPVGWNIPSLTFTLIPSLLSAGSYSFSSRSYNYYTLSYSIIPPSSLPPSLPLFHSLILFRPQVSSKHFITYSIQPFSIQLHPHLQTVEIFFTLRISGHYNTYHICVRTHLQSPHIISQNKKEKKTQPNLAIASYLVGFSHSGIEIYKQRWRTRLVSLT